MKQLITFVAAATLFIGGSVFAIGSALTSSDTQNTERAMVNDLRALTTAFSTTTNNTFTGTNAFTAGWSIAATSTGTNGIALTGGCFSLNGTCLPTTVGSSTLLADANTWTALQLFSNATSTLFTATTAWIDTLNLTNDLTVANGGTGASTLTGLLQGNGTSAFTAITDSSTGGQVLRVTGASTYAWGALDLTDGDAVTGSLTATNGGTGATSLSSAFTVATNVFSSVQTPSFSFPPGAQTATTTTATTTVPLGPAFFAETWNAVACWSGAGNVPYNFTDGTNDMNSLQASTTVSQFLLTSNNTFVAQEKRFIEIGPMTASYISCTISKTI